MAALLSQLHLISALGGIRDSELATSGRNGGNLGGAGKPFVFGGEIVAARADLMKPLSPLGSVKLDLRTTQQPRDQLR